MSKITMNKMMYLLAIYVALTIFLFGIKYSNYYILLIVSSIFFCVSTMMRSRTIDMVNVGRVSALFYIYGVCSFGIGVENLGFVGKTMFVKFLIFSGVLALGVCLFTIAALFNGGWYVKK